ncbi:MAG: 1-(5-phosphoribosyl)-5-[(5-phosphoribosylamino)methylideneamino]imidazole-4-carboxamide isomerase [Kiritimatiellota bacterium]|nr:1-(5-phosphoribosyl)-5-[(5-phosphoribosylamino)methylideneamino]imidazole-4-carboxamide isomerase [Kiritimatiellota bacterium]
MSALTIIPAIDLKGGRCVRLRQGLASDETVYSDDPVQMAQSWEQAGAAWLHVVDLDGAFQGFPVHTALIEKIARAIRIPVEVGGGLRTDDQVEALLALGVARAVLGTRAWTSPETLARLVERFGEHVAVGLDARNGRVSIKGWTETTGTDALALAVRLQSLGVQTLIYTDIAQDGMLTGPNTKAIAELCDRVTCRVIASGGVASAAHVAALAALGKPNLAGVIVGKALYEGTVSFAELQLGSQA